MPKLILSRVITDLRKQHGMPLPEVTEWIPTGCPPLDLALGGGGVPVGRITEIFGREGCGKSTLLESLYVGMRRTLAGLVVDGDAEHKRDQAKLLRLGLKGGEFVYAPPTNLKDFLDFVCELLVTLRDAQWPTLIGVDSLAAISTKEEQDSSLGDTQGQRLHARLLSEFCRKVPALLGPARAALVVINQEKFGSDVFGGKGIPFHATIRLQLRVIERIYDESDFCIGLKVVATPIKNQLSPPFRKALLPLFFDTGFDGTASVLLTLGEYGLLAKEGRMTVCRTASRSAKFFMLERRRFAGWAEKCAEDPVLLQEAAQLLWSPHASDIIHREEQPAEGLTAP